MIRRVWSCGALGAVALALAGAWGWHACRQPGASDVPRLEALLAYVQPLRIAGYSAKGPKQLAYGAVRYCEPAGASCALPGRPASQAFDAQAAAQHADLRRRIRELGLAIDAFRIEYDASGAVAHATLDVADRHLLWYEYSPQEPLLPSHPQLVVTPLAGPWYLQEDIDWN
ncbi:hypothetical protein [Achromobacter sp. NCFB-sbj8-Ac1-l]|uniref:hypothetical protein n=1 Tax=unclassified Achromobacter TaxID=2626865 RepID=UPI004046B9FA